MGSPTNNFSAMTLPSGRLTIFSLFLVKENAELHSKLRLTMFRVRRLISSPLLLVCPMFCHMVKGDAHVVSPEVIGSVRLNNNPLVSVLYRSTVRSTRPSHSDRSTPRFRL